MRRPRRRRRPQQCGPTTYFAEESAALEAGERGVSSKVYTYDVVPNEMAGLMICPSLELHYLDRPGRLQLTAVESGAVFVWAPEHGLEHGAIHLLDDDPSAGWAYFGMDLHWSEAG